MKIVWHKHHIIPKYMGGTNDKKNLIKCNAAMHAFMHKILWEEYGNIEDRLAWKGLSGQISKDEILIEIYRENGIRLGKSNIGRASSNKGKPMSENQKNKLRKPKSEEHKQNLRKPKKDTSKMGRYVRTDEMKEKARQKVLSAHADKGFNNAI